MVSFEFSFVQDHMYQIDRFAEGETAFIYTPAWFDGIEVKDLTIKWNADKAGAWQPDCIQENGYLVFSASLSAGDRYTITVAYPNDAFAFSEDRQADGGGSGGNGGYVEEDDDWFAILGGLFGSSGSSAGSAKGSVSEAPLKMPPKRRSSAPRSNIMRPAPAAAPGA